MRANKTITFWILTVCSFVFISCVKKDATGNENLPASSQANTTPSLHKIDISVPEGWIIFSKPNAESREIQCANAAVKNERKVEIENGKIKILKYVYDEDEQLSKLPEKLKELISKNRKTDRLGGYIHAEPYENGWLIGSDAGEWGGKLFWFKENESQKVELLDDNVRGIIKDGGVFFILSGQAHMVIDEGKIYRLVKDEKLKLQLFSDLKTQPQTFAIENNSFLVALNDKIIRVKTSGEVETIKKTNFNTLYPNSMAITSSGIIYVGMRLFVVRFVPFENSYKEEWLVPQDCQNFAAQDFDCVCQSEK